jgi:hypothetical protein
MLTIASLACAALAACDKGSSLPTSPSAPAPVVFAIEGVVRDAQASNGIAAARVEVAEGVNQGMAVATDADGRYQLTNLSSGAFVLRAAAEGFDATTQPVTLSANQTIDFVLHRPSAPPGPDVTRRTLSGAVFNAADESPIQHARVRIVDGADRGLSAETDARGSFGMQLQPGRAEVEVTAEGFRPFIREVEIASADVRVECPLEPDRPSDPAGRVLTGTTVDGISNDAIAGAIIRIDGGAEAKSGGDGVFAVPVADDASLAGVTITSSSTVERTTHLSVGREPATVTLMPRSLNLAAFDQMFRGNGGELHRWTTAPTVVIERRVLRFTSVGDETFVATGSVMSEGEVADLVNDLKWALPQLSGDVFDDFASTRVEMSAEGDTVQVSRAGTIVVAQYEGLTAATSYWGYTKWAWNGRGEVWAAAVMLDREFDTSTSPYRRSLRAHEFGHAMGYAHVDAQASVMNSSGRVLPNTFDRQGSRMAFLRPPLNRSPDIDPEPMAVRRAPAGLTWTGAP